ncbi:MAG: TetR/AcrR family transcriptional regulator [Coprobacillus sp.]
MKMNVTSQEILIEKAKEVLLKDGVDALSIRKLAKECGISVGVFYNYFETKTDLIFAIVFEFWQEIMHQTDLNNQNDICLYVRTLYTVLRDKIEDFENTWLMQMSVMDSSDKQKGRQLEKQCFAHIMSETGNVIDRDQKISKDVFNDVLTKEAFTHFLIMNTISIARNRHGDCDAFVEIIRRVLYK